MKRLPPFQAMPLGMEDRFATSVCEAGGQARQTMRDEADGTGVWQVVQQVKESAGTTAKPAQRGRHEAVGTL